MKSNARFVAALLLCLPVVAGAQAEWDPDYLISIQAERYTALRTSGSLTIDGALDEPSWQQAP